MESDPDRARHGAHRSPAAGASASHNRRNAASPSASLRAANSAHLIPQPPREDGSHSPFAYRKDQVSANNAASSKHPITITTNGSFSSKNPAASPSLVGDSRRVAPFDIYSRDENKVTASLSDPSTRSTQLHGPFQQPASASVSAGSSLTGSPTPPPIAAATHPWGDQAAAQLKVLKKAAGNLMPKLYRLSRLMAVDPSEPPRPSDALWSTGLLPEFPRLCAHLWRKFPEHPGNMQLEKVKENDA